LPPYVRIPCSFHDGGDRGKRADALTNGAVAAGTSADAAAVMLLLMLWTAVSKEFMPDIALWPVVVAGGGVMYSINQAFP